MVYSLLIVFSSVCAFTDYKFRKILNMITFPAILVGLLYWTINEGLQGVFTWGAGLVVGLLLLIVPFVLGGMGAGDVKMLAMVGALAGAKFVFMSFLFGAVLAGFFCFYYVFVRKGSSKDYIPYGVFISIGVFIQIYLEVGVS